MLIDMASDVANNDMQSEINCTPNVQSPAALPNQYPLVLSHTPGGSEEWVFSSLKEGIEFYRIYALARGFTPRKYTTKTHRGGFRENRQRVIPVTDGKGDIDNNSGIDYIKSARRRVKITRIGCEAHIRFALENNVLVFDQFREGHNHRLSSVHDKDLQKLCRSLSLFHKQSIIDHSKLNIGPSKSFTICKEYVNGYSNVGASLIEFKNFQRDIKCYIGERDVQIFIDRFKKLSGTKNGFFFAYHVDASMTLCRVFWADAEAIKNYSCFGDAISFDPTYGTNKYCMVFTPFTGVDHHKRSNLLKAMSQKEPQCVITDQDPAIKMRFVLFSKKLVTFVPFKFEEKWTELMNDFEMADHSWFSAMFAIRKNWIPAYHRDLPMGCILRTIQSAHSPPVTVTPLHLEPHAAIEVKAAIMSCGVGGFTREQDVEITDVHDAGTCKTFKVFYNISTTAATCTCKLFERRGLLCRHILWVYSGKGTKDALNSDINFVDDNNFVNSNQTNLSKVWSEFHETVSLLKTVPDVHVEELRKLLVQFREKICPQAEPLTKDQEMEMLLGCSASSDITILPPTK
ncbi:hypothetical protein RND81_13G030800 [Saponaria officinalis]|uniref:SWIM-type domain-containing protein n=1 Tax=Saponaria officinalis TaxID=3572 RepID=A0AAW1GTG4_SAPOF